MNEQSRPTVRVWDPFVRLFHWLLVAGFFTAYLTGDEFKALHTLAGYLVAVLVLARIPWGFVGSRHARFRSFVRPPGEVLAYLRGLRDGTARRYLGHNPAGGMMVIVLLVMLLLTTFFGMATLAADDLEGPLAFLFAGVPHPVEEFFEEGHEVLGTLTLYLVILHIAGVLFESWAHRENLAKAMWTGRKRRQEEDQE